MIRIKKSHAPAASQQKLRERIRFIILLGGLFSLFLSPPAFSSGQSAPLHPEPDSPPWRFIFVPDPGAITGDYSQTEIESFLCAHTGDFITVNDLKIIRNAKVFQYNPNVSRNRRKQNLAFYEIPQYGLSHAELSPDRKEELENLEINKWFEPKATILLKGGFTAADERLTQNFIAAFRAIVPTPELSLETHAQAANIVIEFPGFNSAERPLEKLGEAICLEDNLRIAVTDVGGRLKIQEWRTGAGALFIQSTRITFTPEELAFRKNQRMVKICLADIRDPEMRGQVLIHELLHAMGFSGHSPFPDSRIFPITAPPGSDGTSATSSGNLEKAILSPLASRMLEMLYRPEIQQGMNLKEAATLLTRLKQPSRASAAETEAILTRQRLMLEEEKNRLLTSLRAAQDLRLEMISQRDACDRATDRMNQIIHNVENTLAPEECAGKSTEDVLRLNWARVRETLFRLTQDRSASPEPNKTKSLAANLTAVRRAELEEDAFVWDKLDKDWKNIQKRTAELNAGLMGLGKEEKKQADQLRRVIRRLMILTVIHN